MPRDRAYDSVDLIPHLTGAKSGPPHPALFWRAQRGQWAVRSGPESWKLVRQAGKPDELYRLDRDLSEANDLASKQPDRVAMLSTEIAAWDRQMIAPAFAGTAARKGTKDAKKKKAASGP
jgi:hypothetical protein